MAFGAAETANLIVKLSLGGNFTSQMAKASRMAQKFDKDATRGYKAGAQIGTGIKRSALLAAGGLGLLAGAIGKSVDAAGDFEAQLNTINTIARVSPQLLGKIGDSIRQVAKDTGTSLDDLTQGYYDLLSAGIKAADAQDVLTQANKLAIGGLSTTAESIDLLTTAINVYGGNAKNAASYTDIFAKAIERGKVTAADLAGSFSIVGPIAAASKIEITELAAGFARLTATGIPAAEAATDMRSAIVALTRTTKPLEALQKATGRNYLKIAGKKGLVFALETLRTDAAKAGVPLIELLGRVEGLNFTLATTGPNFDDYNADLAAMGLAAGTAADQMAERQKGLNFQLKVLKALAKDAGITIGTALLPKLTPVVAALNKFINDNQGKIAEFGDQLAGAFTPEGIISGIKGITGALAPMIDLIKVAAAPVKAITQAFLSLPKEVQTVLIGAFAVNKLTGGLVTNAAGGIIEAIGKGLLGGIKAPVVNVQGGVVNVGGGVGGAAGAAGMGLAGKLATLSIVATAVYLGADSIQGFVNKNNTLKEAGLTPKEITAQKFFTSTPADQQAAFKHLGYLPTKSDYDSGTAKITGAVRAAAAASLGTTAAVERIPSPSVSNFVSTKVYITAGGIKRTVTQQTRHGRTSGSRNTVSSGAGTGSTGNWT